MLDHLLGRPSTSWRKTQVVATAMFWILYLRNANANGPAFLQRYSKRLARLLTPWQQLLIVMNAVYIVKHLDALVGLAAPEPLEHMYSANFYRATWFLTALDAGFWTAMPIRPKWLKHTASLLFSLYYLIFASQADEKVRKIRATITVEQLRVSWEKQSSPVIKIMSNLLRPKINIIKKIEIEREDLPSVEAWLYFDGTLDELAQQEKIVISFPGGGFVAMTPRDHDDSHTSWAKKLGAPLISINYKKAPEEVYPYALYECFDAYKEIMLSKGACLQMGMNKIRKVALVGDSAGGNYVASVMLMLLENQSQTQVPLPSGLVLIYPFLDFNITSWMSADHLRLLRQESAGDIGVLNSKRHHERRKSVLQVYPDGVSSSLRLSDIKSQAQRSINHDQKKTSTSLGRSRSSSMERHQDRPVGTRLAMTSRVSFFQDRIISPDMMRAMALLYIGPKSKPDFQADYLLSPILAPSHLLAKFPKTYFICGEVDPFVDDTVIMAGRIREAKQAAAQRYQELSMSHSSKELQDDVEMTLIRGTSHGFLQMRAILPEARNGIARCRSWMQAILADASDDHSQTRERHRPNPVITSGKTKFTSGDESEDPKTPKLDEANTQFSDDSNDTKPPRLVRGMTHNQWETEHLLTQDELLNNRKTAITRSFAIKE